MNAGIPAPIGLQGVDGGAARVVRSSWHARVWGSDGAHVCATVALAVGVREAGHAKAFGCKESGLEPVYGGAAGVVRSQFARRCRVDRSLTPRMVRIENAAIGAPSGRTGREHWRHARPTVGADYATVTAARSRTCCKNYGFTTRHVSFEIGIKACYRNFWVRWIEHGCFASPSCVVNLPAV